MGEAHCQGDPHLRGCLVWSCLVSGGGGGCGYSDPCMESRSRGWGGGVAGRGKFRLAYSANQPNLKWMPNNSAKSYLNMEHRHPWACFKLFFFLFLVKHCCVTKCHCWVTDSSRFTQRLSRCVMVWNFGADKWQRSVCFFLWRRCSGRHELMLSLAAAAAAALTGVEYNGSNAVQGWL